MEHGDKSEIQISNSKQIQNPNLQMFKTDTTTRISRSLGFGHCDFDHSDLFRARPVEFRYADPPEAGFHRASASYFEFDVHPVP